MTDFEELEDMEDIEKSVKRSKKEKLETDRPDSFFTIASDLSKKVSWKIAIFLFLIYVFLNTRTFIDQILGRVNGAVEAGCPNAKGTLILGLLLVISYIILSLLVDADVL